MGSTLTKCHGHASHCKEGHRTNNSKNGNRNARMGTVSFFRVIDLRGHRGIGKGHLELEAGSLGAISNCQFTKSAASFSELQLEGSFDSYIRAGEIEQVNG